MAAVNCNLSGLSGTGQNELFPVGEAINPAAESAAINPAAAYAATIKQADELAAQDQAARSTAVKRAAKSAAQDEVDPLAPDELSVVGTSTTSSKAIFKLKPYAASFFFF